MMKTTYMSILLFLALLVTATAAHASPIAKVAAFPYGEGLEEFLSGIDTSKMIRTERPTDLTHPVAFVVVPLHKNTRVDVFRAELNQKTFQVRPIISEPLANGDWDHGLVFWSHVPGSIPYSVVYLLIKDETGGRTHFFEFFWPQEFSGEDGSLVTNEEFIAF